MGDCHTGLGERNMLGRVENNLAQHIFCLLSFLLAFSVRWMGACLSPLVLLPDFQLFRFLQYSYQRYKLLFGNRVIVDFQAGKVHPRLFLLFAALVIHGVLQAIPDLPGKPKRGALRYGEAVELG